jgi:hypothetical protein
VLVSFPLVFVPQPFENYSMQIFFLSHNYRYANKFRTKSLVRAA